MYLRIIERVRVVLGEGTRAGHFANDELFRLRAAFFFFMIDERSNRGSRDIDRSRGRKVTIEINC